MPSCFSCCPPRKAVRQVRSQLCSGKNSCFCRSCQAVFTGQLLRKSGRLLFQWKSGFALLALVVLVKPNLLRLNLLQTAFYIYRTGFPLHKFWTAPPSPPPFQSVFRRTGLKLRIYIQLVDNSFAYFSVGLVGGKMKNIFPES